MLPEIVVGAADIVTVKQARRASRAGAKFITCPGTSVDVIETARLSMALPVVPGVATASDITTATSLGCKLLRFFPSHYTVTSLPPGGAPLSCRDSNRVVLTLPKIVGGRSGRGRWLLRRVNTGCHQQTVSQRGKKAPKTHQHSNISHLDVGH